MLRHPTTLILNADYRPLSYFPLSTWPWEDAVHALYRGKVEVVAEYDQIVRSPSTEIKIPSVVALKEYQSVAKKVIFTRFNVFLRDGFRCQYCGGRFKVEDLTFDHVLPRCRGGVTSWTNVVAACRICNGLKADKMSMKPFRAPVKPSIFQLQEAGRSFPPKYLHESWGDFLYWDSPLDP